MLAPEFLALLEQRKSAQLPIIGVASVDELRAQTPARIALAGPIPSGVTITQRVIPTRDGTLLDAHVLRAVSSDDHPTPLIVYFHGGGWVHNTIDIYDASLAQLAVASGITIISVNYRKAPEHPFPIPLNDCWDALLWCRVHADELQISPDVISIAGDSSGGNLAAAIAIMASGVIPLRAQVLVYPCLDPSLTTASSHLFEQGYGLDRTAMQWYWSQYVQDERLLDDPRVAPIRSHDVSMVPRTMIIAAEHDILRDDAHAYHDKLLSHGVDSTYRLYEGTIHGFLTFGSVSSIPTQLIHDIATWM